jgi:hypothetical protein
MLPEGFQNTDILLCITLNKLHVDSLCSCILQDIAGSVIFCLNYFMTLYQLLVLCIVE